MKNALKFSALLFALSAMALVIYSCASDDSDTTTATAEMVATNNSGLSGTVTFTEDADGGVTMEANISGIAEGEYAIHIHAMGDCSAADGTSAGGHWNPTNEDHGVWGTAPFHLGDIGNITIGADGTGTISRTTDLWCVGCGEDNDVVGKGMIVHEGIDDFSSQPSGAAGARIGCGVIELQ